VSSLEYVQGRVVLPEGSVLRIDDGAGTVLHVWQGALWVTQHGDPRDYYVAAGESLQLDRDGPAVASPVGRALASLTAPRPAGPSLVTRLLARIGLANAGYAA
jgi:hypothetical protein